jgi:NADPH:quinone reductase-like Zn-dependent oxidoreductase
MRTKPGIQPDGAGALIVVDADRGRPVRVTPWGASFLDNAWSPDGEWIVFSMQDARGATILGRAADGSDLRPITTSSGVDAITPLGHAERGSRDTRRPRGGSGWVGPVRAPVDGPQATADPWQAMRAAIATRYGAPEVVRVGEVDPPSPKPGELLVRVRASTVNRTDCGFRAAKPFIVRPFSGLVRPRRPVLGCDVAGVVEGLGPGVESFRVGDRVYGFDDSHFGAHAELSTIAADRVARIPDGVSFDDAAASIEGPHYAHGVIRTAKIEPGQRILVNGATGAIGSATVQLLSGLDVHVTAVCEGAHADLVRGLGADRIIDYTTEDFTRLGETFDLVLDTVGKSSFGRCKPILAPRGVYISSELGPWSMNPLLALGTPLFRGKRVVFPVPRKADWAALATVAEMLAAGTYTPVIDRRYPLEDIVEAYRYVESGRKIGSVLLQI